MPNRISSCFMRKSEVYSLIDDFQRFGKKYGVAYLKDEDEYQFKDWVDKHNKSQWLCLYTVSNEFSDFINWVQYINYMVEIFDKTFDNNIELINGLIVNEQFLKGSRVARSNVRSILRCDGRIK